MRGRPPKPTAELRLTGTFRADRHAAREATELMMPASPPKMPTTLSREAKAEWKRIVKALERKGVLAETDRMALAVTCELWADERDLVRLLTRFTMGSSDWKRIHGALQDVRKLLKDFHAKFGMSPADRHRVKPAADSSVDPPRNPWAKPRG